MNIGKDSVVHFHYRLRDAAGQALEDSHGGEPLGYLHGHGAIIAGLERELSGKAAGDRFTVTIPPELAYGVRQDNATQRIQMKHVMTPGKLRPGMTITINTDRGHRQVQVLKPGKFVVDVDINHPLAGMELTFDIEVVDVRAATPEELAHGHVHGPGGHSH